MYLGLVLALSGWALLLGSPLTLLLVWALVRILEVVQIVPEEAVLRVKFGSAYVDYSMRVHRWFGVYGRPKLRASGGRRSTGADPALSNDRSVHRL